MLINFLELTRHVELSYSVKYKSYDIVIRQLIPTKSDLPPWFCCYINKGQDFTDEDLDLIPVWYGITYDSVYPDSWVKSSLTGRWVLGWDYHHGDENELTESVQDIIKDAQQVIDFILQTSNKGE